MKLTVFSLPLSTSYIESKTYVILPFQEYALQTNNALFLSILEKIHQKYLVVSFFYRFIVPMKMIKPISREIMPIMA